MSKGCLYIDFGATRIKWVLDNKKGAKSGEIPNPYIKQGFLVEINVKKLLGSINNLISQVHKKSPFELIMISSQMHGFALADKNGDLLTNIVSWMDQRYYNSNRKEYDFFVSEHSELFGEITGMPVKSGLPFFNSISLLQNVKEKEVKILSLPEVILRGLKAKNFGVHSSMIAASGFYDIYKKEISVDLCKMHRKVTGKNVIFNPVSYGFDLYEIQVNAKPVKVSIGYGDHQCSVLGAENDHQTVSLNLGTGSQVSKIIPEDKIASIARNNQLQKRPYFNTDYLVCVTHIPSGRVLNQFIGLFKGDIWKDVQKLSLADVKKATLRFDLSVFNDAWGFSGGGSVTNLQEGGISYHNFISSLIRSYIFQYIRIVNMLEESLKTKSDSIILSGGVAQRIPAIKKLLTAELSRKIIQKRVFKDRDEAILGLKKILLQTK